MKPLDVPPQPDVDTQLFEVYPEHMHAAIEHAHGTEDPVFSARPSPEQQQHMSMFGRRKFSNDPWVPAGFHAGIHWEHASLESAGEFAFVRRRAHCWHYTVSPPNTVDAMWRVLRDKRAAPHFVLGFRNGTVRPVVIQCMPLNVPGRALAHPSGPETNRAGVLIQTEVCSNPSDVRKWDDWGMYKAFANFIRVINETMVGSISWEVARSFDNSHRFGGQEFTEVDGHFGHMHVPVNDHTDPAGMSGDNLEFRLKHLESGNYYDLQGVGP